MSSQLTNLVPVMTGSNYLAWKDAITVFLKSQGVWRICTGDDWRPADLTTGMNVDTAHVVQEDQCQWMN